MMLALGLGLAFPTACGGEPPEPEASDPDDVFESDLHRRHFESTADDVRVAKKNVYLELEGRVNEKPPDAWTWSRLEEIKGDFAIQIASHSVHSVTMADLKVVGGNMTVFRNLGVEQVSLPKLERVEGDLKIRANKNMDTLSMPVLTQVGGDLTIGGRNARDKNTITALDLAALESLGGNLMASGATLPRCEIEAVVERLKAKGWKGRAELYGLDDKAMCD